MKTKTQLLQEYFELANHYPSPHNGQPIEVVQIDGQNFTLYFHKERGLQATEVSFMFSYVTMGVFVYHLSLCAKALGHAFVCNLELPPVTALKGEGTVAFASIKLEFKVASPDTLLHQTLLFRQTSRKKYSAGLTGELSGRTIALTNAKHLQLIKMDQAGTHQAIWLNQRAVFDDMFDDAMRHELDHWLRYSKAEKEAKKDGLAYDCMELDGRVMKFIVRHYRLLRMPGISSLLKKYYLRTMSDKSDAYYMLTPFSSGQEAFDVGMAVMQIWETIAAEGYYLHPFGTIMSNAAAHADFLKLVGIEHEDIHQNFLVFIYRAGKSEKPNSSLRIPVNQHLLRSNDV